MTEQASVPPASKRKFVYFVAIILFLIVALSWGWYWASNRLDKTLSDMAANLQQQGKNLVCENQEVRGYPFRLGVFCDSVTYGDQQNGIEVNGQAFRSAAQLYRPGHMVAEADGPYDISVPGLAPMTLEWSNLKSSGRVGTSGFQRLSVVADQFRISANDFGARDLLGTLEEIQFHARPSPENEESDLDVAFSGNRWVVDDNGLNQIEPIDFSLQMKLGEGLRIIQERTDLRSVLQAQGGSGELREFQVATESGGRLRLSGPLEVSQNGLVSGELTLDLDDPQRLVLYAQSVFPPLAQTLEQYIQYLEAFAQKSDGKIKIRDLKLAIKDGKVFLGFFEIGQIPRLF